MIIKGLIDQSYKILHRKRLHLENVPSSDKVNFTFPIENRENTAENLDKDLPFINFQQTLLTKSQGSFSNPGSESPLILNNQIEFDNVRAKILTLKYFFMEEIYDLKQEISSVQSQLGEERLYHSRNDHHWKERLKNTGISITERLTKHRMEFLKKAKNEFGFNNIWMVDGGICYYDEVAKKVKVYFD